jgi:hypothetical protein
LSQPQLYPIGGVSGEVTESGLKDDHEYEKGDGEEGVHDAHHDGVDPASHESGHRSIDYAYGNGYGGGDQAYENGNLSTVEDAGEEVAPERIRAEPMLSRGAYELVDQIDLIWIFTEPSEDEAEENHERNHTQAGHGELVFGHALAGVLPDGGALLGCADGFFRHGVSQRCPRCERGGRGARLGCRREGS